MSDEEIADKEQEEQEQETQEESEKTEREKKLEKRLKRLAADFENYKKRKEKEEEEVKEKVKKETILELLPILDEFEIALSHNEDEGFKLIYTKLLDYLRDQGVERMDSQGEEFDHNKHDAIKYSEGEKNKVVDVMQQGYTFKNSVLRHAKVIVGNGGQNGEEEKDE